MKRILAALLAAALLLGLAACGAEIDDLVPSPSVTPTATPRPTPTPTPTPEPTPTPLPYTNPLSGEGMAEDISSLRPWAIMINNIQQALPQCGVSDAEIIYEIPAEGGVTRMMAIFTDISDVEKIGSLRSIRPYYADVGISYDAIVVHAGGSEESYTEMSGYSVDHLDGVLGTYTEGAFYRDPDRMQYGLEHSMFSKGSALMQAAEDEGFPLEHDGGAYDYGLTFSEDAAEQCTETADYVTVQFNGYKSTVFEYDEESGKYLAYQYGEEYIDSDTGEQMSFTNLLVLNTSMSVLDSVGRLSVRTTGEGEGYFMCGGNYVPITWTRADNTSPFIYYLADGTQLDFGIGNSYIAFIASYSSVSFTQEAE
ncbi:MAG TPA: DUF3048 domain-containing protein [Candidatus Scatomorpha intestinavium]|uniref:DUF3048 domain-containing protein n=1 Tax=Candidatus Scatomorpha intestinavium TaxID=2840922 RepID=A0A9D0ZFZ2_9FIRM|nr:DUF3048 domain-containing protein [Candidatus Scatomorpha intestinavium]